MQPKFFTLLALCSLVAGSACSSNSTTSAEGTPASARTGVDTAPAVADSRTAQDVPQAAAVEHPLTKTIVVPAKPKPGAPHGPGFDMPLIELGGYAPPRPMEVLKDAHMFTADHPEVASFIPCYCGCGSSGHQDNADCFVRQRDAQGRVTEWEPHGAACAVCIDIAVQSMKMRNSGASISAIRQQVQNDYRPRFPTTETPTPAPPAGK
jgi:hypothetical protein